MVWHARLRWQLVLVLLAACSSVPTEADAPADPVESDSAVDGDIEVSPDDQRMMYGVVVAAICAETACPPAVVFNDFSGNPITTGRVLPPIVKAALEQALRGEVTYIHPEAFRGGSALLIGPIEKRRDDLVSIMAGYLCGNMCGNGREHFFLLQGDKWIPVTAEKAGMEFEAIWAA
jgi:hypothetical protein